MEVPKYNPEGLNLPAIPAELAKLVYEKLGWVYPVDAGNNEGVLMTGDPLMEDEEKARKEADLVHGNDQTPSSE